MADDTGGYSLNQDKLGEVGDCKRTHILFGYEDNADPLSIKLHDAAKICGESDEIGDPVSHPRIE